MKAITRYMISDRFEDDEDAKQEVPIDVVPCGHVIHWLLDDNPGNDENLPAGHITQVAYETAPSSVENRPAGQSIHRFSLLNP